MACSARSFSAPSVAANAGTPSRHNEMCRCWLLPECSENGLAMKLASLPCLRATSLAAYFSRARVVGGIERVGVDQVGFHLTWAVFGLDALQSA